MVPVLKVSTTAIKETSVEKMGGFAESVHQGVYILNPTVFKGEKPVTEIVFTDSIALFNSTRTAYKQGGTSSKTPYDNAYAALLVNIISLKPYVDGIANGDEVTLKLSMLPYSDGVNETGILIKNGALPTELTYTPGATGVAKVSCKSFGKGAKFICFATQGSEFPVGTYVSLDGQIIIPFGATMPTVIINVNGKRSKTLINMIPKTDYYLTFVMLCGGYVSNLSAALKIACGN